MPVLSETQRANVREALSRWHGFKSLEAIRPALEAAAAGALVRWHRVALAALDVPKLDPQALSVAVDLACVQRPHASRRALAASVRARVARYHRESI